MGKRSRRSARSSTHASGAPRPQEANGPERTPEKLTATEHAQPVLTSRDVPDARMVRVRVPSEVWEAFRSEARRQGMPAGTVLGRLAERFVADPSLQV